MQRPCCIERTNIGRNYFPLPVLNCFVAKKTNTTTILFFPLSLNDQPSRQDLYLTKKEEVDVKSKRVIVGLEKLKKGAADVELMKVGRMAAFSVQSEFFNKDVCLRNAAW